MKIKKKKKPRIFESKKKHYRDEPEIGHHSAKNMRTFSDSLQIHS